MKKESLFIKIWDAVWPLFIYLIVQNIVLSIVIFITGEGYSEYVMPSILASAIISIPIYYGMYKRDREKEFKKDRNIPMENKDIVMILLCGATLALAVNNVIAITPLPYIFTGYQDTNQVIYGSQRLVQILSAGIFCCIVEELSMRGILYPRLRKIFGKRKAIFFSAVIFGLYHLNLVQGVYAFVLGIFFAWIYERYDSLGASILGHISANMFILLLSESSIFQKVTNTLTGFCLVTCISFMIFYYGLRWIKQSNPVVELEFVEKRPDTLKGLSEEYKEQANEEEK